jgi:polyphosphate kinase
MDHVPTSLTPHLFINRELSLLEFNQRVLELAEDATLPPLERLRFLCISSNNLDEFFEIRVAGLKQLVELGGTRVGADAMPINEQLEAIHERAATLIRDQYTCLNAQIVPTLAGHGVHLPSRDQWTPVQRAWL